MWQPAVTAERSLSKLTLSNELESWDFIEQFVYDTDVFRPTLIISSDIIVLVVWTIQFKVSFDWLFPAKEKTADLHIKHLQPSKARCWGWRRHSCIMGAACWGASTGRCKRHYFICWWNYLKLLFSVQTVWLNS